MSAQQSNRTGERGNAFFIVMITIILFAGLMFVFSRGARQGGNKLTSKQSEIAASDIITYAQTVRRAVDRVYSKGESENAISFEADNNTGYANANCTDNYCKVFSPSGGSIGWSEPDHSASNNKPWFFSGENTITGVGVTNNPDLLMMLTDVTPSVCEALNDALGIATMPSDSNGIETTTKFQGVYTNTEQIGGASLDGVTAACVNDSGTYVFYFVLLER